MIHTDDRFRDAVTTTVEHVESLTDAEIVVVAAARSSAYRDVSTRVASVGALVVVAVQIAVPWAIGELWFLLDTVLAWLALDWLARRPAVLRRLTREARRKREVDAAAAREFVHEAVHGTPNRSGVLVYVSALEGRVAVLPDLGIQGKVPPGELAKARKCFAHDDVDHFVAGLEALGEVLARHVPHTEDSDAIDLPNAPRVRP